MGSHQTMQPSFEDLGTPLSETTFCVVDLETTGGSDSDRITEIGAVKVRGGEVIGEFQTLINPNTHIPASIAVLTGITNHMVAGAPSIASVLPSFLEFSRGAVLVAHNARFDVGFLRRACEENDTPWPKPRVVDTVALSRNILNRGEVRNHKLQTLAAYFGATTTPNHRALSDARATVDLLHGLLERVGNVGVHTIEDLTDYTHRVSGARRVKRQWAKHIPNGPGVYAFYVVHSSCTSPASPIDSDEPPPSTDTRRTPDDAPELGSSPRTEPEKELMPGVPISSGMHTPEPDNPEPDNPESDNPELSNPEFSDDANASQPQMLPENDRDREEVLYVGTASNLYRRVRSYFTASEKRSRMEEMIRIADGVRTWSCATSLEASVRELRMIQSHQPRYNRRSRRQDRAIWIKLTDEPFPRLSIVTRTPRVTDSFLGPFSRREIAEEVCLVLQETYLIRRCTQRLSRRRSSPRCALADMGKCLAPCEVSRDDFEPTYPVDPRENPVIPRNTSELHSNLTERADGTHHRELYLHQVARLQDEWLSDITSSVTALSRRIAERRDSERFEEAAQLRDRLSHYVEAVMRFNRLTAIARCPEIVAARWNESRWDVHIIRHGRLAAAFQARTRHEVIRELPTHQASAASVIPPEPGRLTCSAEEAAVIANWLEKPDIRLVRISGSWCQPRRAGLGKEGLARHVTSEAEMSIDTQGLPGFPVEFKGWFNLIENVDRPPVSGASRAPVRAESSNINQPEIAMDRRASAQSPTLAVDRHSHTQTQLVEVESQVKDTVSASA